MVDGQMRLVLRHLHRLMRRGEEGAPSDGALLERFAKDNDEPAFEELLRRHAALVLGTVRRVLGNGPDAEDAFQATFLVLVRKAAALKRDGPLAPWLYTVAYHTALRARGAAARRQRQERQVARMPTVPPDDELLWRDLRPVLDEELDRLGEKYRAPVVLCYLEGKTHEEAARELGWPRGTVAGRLARAKTLLRHRLQRRGVTLSGCVTGGAADPLPAPAPTVVPPGLLAGTLKASLLLTAGEAARAGAFSASVVALAEGALSALSAGRTKTMLLSLLALALLTGGAGVGHLALTERGREMPATPSPARAAPSVSASRALARAEQPVEVGGLADWPMYRGNPSRSAQATGQPPLARVIWARATVRTETAEGWLRQAARQAEHRSRPLLPAFFPLATGDRAIHHSHWGLHAVDLNTGELAWESPSLGGLDQLLSKGTSPGTAEGLAAWLDFLVRERRPLGVLFENSTTGTLSTDGQCVYAVDDRAVVPGPRELFGASAAGNHNVLRAFELAGGRCLWELGGPAAISGREAAPLAESYFLGPPLPFGGKLYVLNQKDGPEAGPRSGELRLLCLGPGANRGPVIEWMVPVARGLGPLGPAAGRAQAAHVAAADGLLVCPTNGGAVVGVDLRQRKVAWRYVYRSREVAPPAPGRNWAVTAPILHGGKVVFTAPDDDAVHCLRLRDGLPLWKAKRDGDLYLAAVAGGKVLLVGAQRCRALLLRDGRPSWQVVAGRPSGQGTARDGSYYLPLQSALSTGQPGVAAVDMARGAVVAHIPWARGEVPGNLVFGGDRVLSQTLTRLTAHPRGQAETDVPDVQPRRPRDGSRARAALPRPRARQRGARESMAKPLVTDEVWERIQPMLPAPKPRRARYPGRKPIDPRRVLTGIVFVLKSGIPWEELPVEMGCGCGMTCLNYLKTWQQNGLWAKMHEVLLAHLAGADRIDWSRVGRDESPAPAGQQPIVQTPAPAAPSNGAAPSLPKEGAAQEGGFFHGGGRESKWAAPLVAPAPVM